MIINSADFCKIPNLINATLSESTDGASVLSLEFNGFADDIDAAELEWMAPWAVIHAGQLLFSGRVTDISRTNSAGAKSTTVTITNAMWLLDHVPYGAQLAEIKAAAEAEAQNNANAGGYPSIVEAAEETFASWETAAAACRVDAPLWLADADGAPLQNAVITVDATRANPSLYTNYHPDGVITAWTALLAMREANPDAIFRFNYERGTVEIISLENASVISYDTGEIDICEISDISPQYENRCEGVACVVTWYFEELLEIVANYQQQMGRYDGLKLDRQLKSFLTSLLSQFVDDTYINQLREAGFNVDDPAEYAGSLSFTYPEEGVEMGASLVQIVNASCYTRTQAEEQASYIRAQVEAYFNACNVANYAGSLTVLMRDITESPIACRVNITGEGAHESWGNMRAVASSVEWDFLGGRVSITLGYSPPGGNFKTLQFEKPVLPSAWERETEYSDEVKHGSGHISDGGGGGGGGSKESAHWTYSKDTDTGSSGSGSHSQGSGSHGGGCNCSTRWEENNKRLEEIERQIAEILKRLEDKCDCAERLFAMIEAAIKAQINTIAFSAQVETELNQNDNGTVISTSAFDIRANGNGSARVSYGYKE